MTQRILCEESVEYKKETFQEKIFQKSKCPAKTLFDDNEEIEDHLNAPKLIKAITKNKEIDSDYTSVFARVKQFAARKKPIVSRTVNAILNRPSIKDRYC